MDGTWRFIDPAEFIERGLIVERLNMNTLGQGMATGVTRGLGVRAVNLGTVEEGGEMMGEGQALRMIGNGHKAARRVGFNLWSLDVGFDALLQLGNDVAREISRENMIEYQWPNQTEPRYIHTFPGNVTGHFRAQEYVLQKLVKLLIDEEGLPVELPCLPGFYLPARLGGVNLLQNSSFRLDTNDDGIPDNWEYNTVTGATLGYDEDTRSHRVYWSYPSSTGLRFWQYAPASAGETYTVHMLMAWDEGIKGALRLRLSFHDAADLLVGSVVDVAHPDSTATGILRRVSVTGTAPPGTAQIAIQPCSDGAAGSYSIFRFSEPQVERGSSVSAYRTGQEIVKNGGSKPRGFYINNPGPFYAPVRLEMRPQETTAKVVEVLLALASERRVNLPLLFDAALYNVTLGDDTASVGDLAAVNGNAARTTFAGAPGWRRRWRKTIYATAPGAMNGRYKVLLIGRASGPSVFRIQLRTSQGERNPVQRAHQVHTYNAEDLDAFEYSTIDMGTVDIHDDAFTFEGWARRVEGADNFHWDHLCLIPVDETVTRLRVPAHDRGGSNRTVRYGDELVTYAGTPIIRNTTMTLKTLNDAAANESNLLLPSGRHSVEISCELRNKNEDKVRLGWLEVRKADSTLVNRIALRTRKRLRTELRKRVVFTADGTTSYRFIVVMDNVPASSDARVWIRNLVHDYARTAGSADALILDAIRREAKLAELMTEVLPVFTRGSSAYTRSGALASSGMPRYENGWRNQAILLEEGTTNLLTAALSTDFATGWSLGALTVTNNATTSPDGTATADRLVETATTAVHTISASLGDKSAAPQSYSVYAKANQRSWLYIRGTGGSGGKAWFDLTNGVVGTVTGGSASIESVGSGWYRCTFSRTLGNVGEFIVIGVATGDNIESYAGSTANGLYVWHAQAEDKAYPTTWQIGGTPRISEGFTIPSSILSPDEGSIEIVVYDDGRTTIAQHAFDTSNTAGRMYLYHAAGSTNWTLGINGAAMAPAVPRGAVGWHRFVVTWKDGKTRLFMDGNEELDLNVMPTFSGVTTFYVGMNFNGQSIINNLVDELRISSKAREGEEITDGYGLDEDVTAYLPFDGTYDAWEGPEAGVPIVPRGGYVWVPPGDSYLQFLIGDAQASGYNDVVEDQNLSKFDPTRTLAVTPTLLPTVLE